MAQHPVDLVQLLKAAAEARKAVDDYEEAMAGGVDFDPDEYSRLKKAAADADAAQHRARQAGA